MIYKEVDGNKDWLQRAMRYAMIAYSTRKRFTRCGGVRSDKTGANGDANGTASSLTPGAPRSNGKR